MRGILYDEIGRGYASVRRPDPRVAAAIHAALTGFASVVNIGAGSGSYEPTDMDVIAVEPSAQMRAQRPVGAAGCLAGVAERLPLDDASVDVAMAVNSDFHWSDRRAGIAEMLRVSRRRVVIVTVDATVSDEYWFLRDYLPETREVFTPLSEVTSALPGDCVVASVPIPSDCSDGSVLAYWKRPAAFLDAGNTSPMAVFSRVSPARIVAALTQLRADLETGAWQARNRELLDLDSFDVGQRLVVFDQQARPCRA